MPKLSGRLETAITRYVVFCLGELSTFLVRMLTQGTLDKNECSEKEVAPWTFRLLVRAMSR